jgi:hypothetical protein
MLKRVDDRFLPKNILRTRAIPFFEEELDRPPVRAALSDALTKLTGDGFWRLPRLTPLAIGWAVLEQEGFKVRDLIVERLQAADSETLHRWAECGLDPSPRGTSQAFVKETLAFVIGRTIVASPRWKQKASEIADTRRKMRCIKHVLET